MRAISQSGELVGTMAWMAPELFQRQAQYTFKSDVYGLGMTFWELASRHIPFQDALSPHLIPGWIIKGERERIPEDCPEKFASAIKACWQQEPSQRPTARELTEFLLSEVREMSDFLPSFRSNMNTPAVSSVYEGNLYSDPIDQKVSNYGRV
jgi:serine/threonine protein kinase